MPSATTIARSRATSDARFTGPLLAVSAAINTQSAPCPPECRRHKSRNSASDVVTANAPIFAASCARSGCKSKPMTRHPAATRTCSVSCPRRPSPISATVSPSLASAVRTPWMATAPTVVNAALSKFTLAEGIRATSIRGTHANSACTANPAPAHATRSPGFRSQIPSPTSSTVPALL